MSFEKCLQNKCLNSKVFQSDYCFEHSIDKEKTSKNVRTYINNNSTLFYINASGCDLSGIDLTGKKIYYSRFSEANLKSSIFKKTVIVSSFFDFSDLSSASFISSHIKLSVFGGANLKNSIIDDSVIVFSNFLGVDISFVNFNNSDISHSRFIGSINEECVFYNCNLTKSVFDFIHFDERSLKSSNCEDAYIIRPKEVDVQIKEF